MLLVDIQNIRKSCTAIGMALVPLSMAIGMMAKLLIGNMFLGNAVMFLGLVMMFPFHRILRYKFHFGKLAGCIAFVILAYIYYFATRYDDPMYLVYLGVILVYALELSVLRPVEDIDIEQCASCIWAISFVTILCGYLCYITGAVTILTGAFEYSDTGDMIYDGLTMGYLGIVQIISSFYMLSTKDWKQRYAIGLGILIFLDLIMVFLAFKRTPIVIALFIIFYYSKRLGYLKVTLKKTLIVLVLLICIIGYVLSSPELSEAVSLMFEETVEGITNLVTGNHTGHGLTNSTDMRLENRQLAFETIKNFEPINFVIGAGFMTFWCDMPILQAYMDMGIIGVLIYAYYTILPLIVVFTNKKKDNILFCFGMFSIYGALSCLTSGHPYDHGHWEWLCLLAFAMNYRTYSPDKETSDKKSDEE